MAQISLLIAFIFSFLSLSPLTFAQTTTPAASSTTTVPAIVPSASSYTYFGCYNETSNTNRTGGLRALNGGVNEALDIMTMPLCMAFCKSNGYAYAGIEYTRECYCAQYLSALSAKVDDSNCDLPCKGNASQICGVWKKKEMGMEIVIEVEVRAGVEMEIWQWENRQDWRWIA
ncbi:hypothetical protein EYC80_003183 [Monilinia laxa]|uniref:WSC domain-containing protein n=1 Tax=Monilinia laxa TaxID=61186 RepID=A0A5N6KE83_MONLA|nr:hypothetical protein EYC80_003183 [Monilinia laxa]